VFRLLPALAVLAACLLVASLAAAEPALPPTIAVVETRTAGVLPEAGNAATRQLYATVARLGYRAVPETVTAALAARISAGGPTPADLLRIATDAHADRAVAATLGTRDGRYVVSLTLANADRTGPFFASESSDAAALEGTLDQMARKLLPAAPPPEATTAPADESTRPGEDLGPRLAIQTEGAFGLAERFFYNHLAGARIDYGFPGDFAIGGYLGYANLKGKDGRASNVLPYAQVEYRIHWSSTSGVRIPIRFGSGYLPKNGPFLRLAAGPSFPLGGSVRLGFDVLAPTIWVIRNSTVFSMDVAAEVSFAL
jgi:hypothetical protein